MVPVRQKSAPLGSKKLMMTAFGRADVRDDNWILTKIAFLRRFASAFVSCPQWLFCHSAILHAAWPRLNAVMRMVLPWRWKGVYLASRKCSYRFGWMPVIQRHIGVRFCYCWSDQPILIVRPTPVFPKFFKDIWFFKINFSFFWWFHSKSSLI